MRAYLRLLRVSLAPSALADVAAGLWLSNHGVWPGGAGPWWLMASSSAIYHGAMALNDWRDREHDARTRPSRPIPSGAVAPGAALAIAAVLLVAGPCLAWQHSSSAALLAAGLAVTAVVYDLFGRGAGVGPWLLALCRAGNLAQGLLHGGGEAFDPRTAAMPLALYAMFVFRVSQLGVMEDGAEALRPARARSLALSAATLLALVPLCGPYEPETRHWLGRVVAAGLCWPASAGLARAAWASADWSRERVEACVGMALRRLLVFSAAFTALTIAPDRPQAILGCAVILAGFFVAAALRKAFPPS